MRRAFWALALAWAAAGCVLPPDRLGLLDPTNDEDVEVGSGNSRDASTTLAPRLSIEPQTLDFGRTAANTPKILEAVVSNRGQVPLNISTVNLSGSDFQAFVGNRNVSQYPAVLSDPDRDGQPGLAPEAQFTLRVHYRTETEGPDSGEVQIV